MTAAAVDVERGDVQVTRTREGEVSLTMAPELALVLARIIARFDVMIGWSPETLRRHLFEDPATPDAPVLPGLRGYDPETWHRVLVQLLAEAHLVHTPPAEIVAVRRLAPGDEASMLDVDEPVPFTVVMKGVATERSGPLPGARVRLRMHGMVVAGLPLREVTVVAWLKDVNGGRLVGSGVEDVDHLLRHYRTRRTLMGLPADDRILLTRDRDGAGYLIHVSEVESVVDA